MSHTSGLVLVLRLGLALRRKAWVAIQSQAYLRGTIGNPICIDLQLWAIFAPAIAKRTSLNVLREASTHTGIHTRFGSAPPQRLQLRIIAIAHIVRRRITAQNNRMTRIPVVQTCK